VFPHDGVVAMTMPLQHGGGGGAILVGRDGIVGSLEAAAAAPVMSDAEVYIAGRATHISASSFRYVLDESPTIRRLVARFDLALLMQAHQTALCNAAHLVEARVARWLLEVQDRSAGFDIALTQVKLSSVARCRSSAAPVESSPPSGCLGGDRPVPPSQEAYDGPRAAGR
jgi:CRP-like cAMP-binding protein